MLTRRSTVRLLPAVLLTAAVALAGCGTSDSSSTASASGWDQVSISGDVGSAATLAFKGQVTDRPPRPRCSRKARAPVVQNGDDVILQTVIGDGYTQKTAADSYKDQAPQVVPITDSVARDLPHRARRQEGRHAGGDLHQRGQDLRRPGQPDPPYRQQGRRRPRPRHLSASPSTARTAPPTVPVVGARGREEERRGHRTRTSRAPRSPTAPSTPPTCAAAPAPRSKAGSRSSCITSARSTAPEALRRELQQHPDRLPDRRRQGRQGLGQDPGRSARRQRAWSWRSRRRTATAPQKQNGIKAQLDPLLRGRHPLGRLSDGPMRRRGVSGPAGAGRVSG